MSRLSEMVDWLFDFVGDRAKNATEKDLEEIDGYVRNYTHTHIEHMDVEYAIAVLSATLFLKSKLPSRPALIEKVKLKLQKIGEDVERNLRGLE